MSDYVLSAKAVMDSSGFASGLGALENGMGGLVGKFALGNIAAEAFGAVMDAVGNSVGAAVNRVDTMNNFPKVMSNMGISSEAADASVRKLSEGIDGLPTSLDTAVSGVQRFTSKNEDIEKSTDMFLAVNDAIAAGGAPAEQQASAMEQLSQSYAKGKMDMMEWRSVQQAMPAQLNQIAKSMGMTADELGEGLRKGDVSMDEFIDKIIELDEKGGEGFASFQEQARSATGGIQTAMTNVQNRVNKAVASIIDEIGGENIAAAINGISSHFKDVAEGPIEFISSFKDAFDASGIESRVPELSESLGELKEAGVETFGEMGELLGNLGTAGAPVLGDLAQGAINFATMMTNVTDAYLEGINSMFDRSEMMESQFRDTLGSINGQAGMLDYYTGVIEELTSKQELSTSEQLKLKAAVDGYNSVTGDSVEVTNAAAGELSKSTEEIKKNSDAWADNAYAQAYASQAADLIAENARIEGEMAEESYKLAEAQSAYNAELSKGAEANQYELDRLDTEVQKHQAQVNKLSGEYDANAERIENYQKRSEVANQSLLNFIERHSDLLTMVRGSGVAIEDMVSYLDEMGVSEQQIAEMSDDARKAMVDMASKSSELGSAVGLSASDMTKAFNDAGISLADLASIGTDDFARLWAECDGDVGLMKVKLDEYNDIELEKKEAEVTDNGTADEVKGEIDEINGIDIPDKDVNIVAHDFVTRTVDKIKAKLKEVRSVSVRAPEDDGYASGGYKIPRHADGGILDRATLTNIGWVGEDGAEAIIPLTNQYYMRPFTQSLAKGLSEMSLGSPVYNVMVDGRLLDIDQRVVDAVDTIVDYAQQQAVM